MTNLAEAQALEKKLLLQTYERNPILFTGGRGVYLTDAEGHDYLDLLSGIGCSALGYAHPVLTQAIAIQAAQLLHTSNLFYHPFTAELALRLTELSGLDRIFLCNSGTEAWEAALKLARANAHASGGKLGNKFIALEHSFHGRTIGSVATTQKLAYRAPFAPLMPEVEFVPFNSVEALRAAFSPDVCAILIEPIQGEGGIHPVSQEFFAAARELCDSTGALLIADEIQCGFGAHRQVVRLPAFRHPARRHHAGQAAGWRPAHRRHAVHRARRASDHPGHARNDIRRQPISLCNRDRGHRRDQARPPARAHRRRRRLLQAAARVARHAP